MPETRTRPPAVRVMGGRDAAGEAKGVAGRGTGEQHWTSPFAGKRIHLIGVGGCGMRGLARFLLRCGARVSGSDRVQSRETEELSALGARVFVGQSAGNVPESCDIVVHSAAISAENPELEEAHRRGIEVRKYARMLGNVMGLRTGVAISGTHGKSTTTAMVAYVLRRAGLDPTFVVGAGVEQLGGSSGVGDGPHFVVEACEYDHSFLNLSPRLAAILNIEEDHLDFYPNLDAIIAAFRRFAGCVAPDGVLVVRSGDAAVASAVRGAAARVETFGVECDATWAAEHLRAERGCYRFVVRRGGADHAEVGLRIPGRHQVLNALAAVALAHHCGVEAETIIEALGEFRGAERRLAHRGRTRGVDVYDDYGHHPTEIQATLRALREHHPGRRLWVVFQPHQHSRTRFLLSDFARSFGSADHVIVPDIYFVRDSEAERNAVRSDDLVQRVRAIGGDALYLPTLGAIVEHLLASVRAEDVVLTLGAGDVWKVADELVRRLE